MPVVSKTSELRDLVLAGNDGDFAEPIGVIPMDSNRQYGGQRVDEVRTEFELAGILRTSMNHQELSGPGRDTWATLLASGKVVLMIDPVGNPDALTIKPGDRVKALERLGQPEYTVEQIDAQGHTRMTFLLSRI